MALSFSKFGRYLLALTLLFSRISFALDTLQRNENSRSLSPVLGQAWSPAPESGLLRRQTTATTKDKYSCSTDEPCSNGACCGQSGVCGYGPTYCGDGCTSNCDATAECGQYSESGDATCPLNVCCSQYGFCGTTDDFCGTGCQSNCGTPSSPSSERGDVRNNIIGYYESWRSSGDSCGMMDPSQIPIEALNQVNYAFVYIVPDTYDLQPMDNDWSVMTKVADAKSRNPDAKLWVSIGGWSYSDNDTSTQPVFGDIASDSTKSANFANKLVSFMNQYGFDGVDFDWEYPGASDRGGKDRDVDNYPKLLSVVRTAFKTHSKSNWGISITVPTSYWYLRWFNMEKLSDQVDHFNLMAYDLHGTWDSTDPIGPYVYAHTNITEIEAALSLFWRVDVEPSKINLGLAFYGRSFTLKSPTCTKPGCEFSSAGAQGPCTKTAGILSYREIMQIQADNDGSYDAYYDKEAAINYMIYKTDSRDRSYSWISYDDKTTFQQKIDFANEQGLGGLLIWAIDQDDDSFNALEAVTGKDIASTTALSTTYGDWNVNDCYITDCEDTCKTGWTTLFQLNEDKNGKGCPNSGKSKEKSKQRSYCCPPWGAPNPDSCGWRGTPHECYGQCKPGEVLMATDNFAGGGSGGWCRVGKYAYCCEATNGAAAIAKCSKKTGDCSGDTPQSLTSLANNDAFSNEGAHLCCPESPTFNNCGWHGASTTCNNNRCPTGQVEIYRDTQGNKGAACVLGRQKVFCCDPPYSGSAFIPVPLEDLFPNGGSLPSTDEPVYFEAFDNDKNEKPTYTSDATDDPNKEPFAWTIMVGAEEDVQSLRRRDGSHLEAFECPNPAPSDYSTQTVKLVCMEEGENNCEHVLAGGAHGTVVRLPENCGPDEWVRVVSFEQVVADAVPGELVKRAPVDFKVYQLRYDYNFRQLRRDGSEIYVRLDVSDHPGYWDAIVSSTTSTSKRDAKDWRDFHMGWFEERGYVNGSAQELYKRGESSSSGWWLNNFNTLLTQGSADGGWGIKQSYEYDQVLYSATRSCPPSATASVTATIQGSLQGRLDFGVSLIGTLRNFDFSESYAYFQLTSLSATAGAVLEANAAISMESTVQPLQVDLDPWGGSFNIKGLWEVGPYVDVTAQLQAKATISGRLSANSTITSSDFTWMYPDSLGQSPSSSDVQEFFHSPRIVSGTEASISADGSVTMTLTPSVGFRVKLNALGSSLVNTDAKAYMQSALTFNVGASTSGCSGAYYGLTGGIKVGLEMTDPLPGWTSTKSKTVVEDTWALQDLKCYSWSSDSNSKRAQLQSRASIVSALFPDVNAKNIACPRDITSTSTGCGSLVPDNSDIFGADSVDQGVVPTTSGDSTSTKRSTLEGGGYGDVSGAFSRWSEAPDYDEGQDLNYLSKRVSSKPSFSICDGDSRITFAGFNYPSGTDLIDGTGGAPATRPTAYTKYSDCDTYGITTDANPTQAGVDGPDWIAEHVLEWQLVQDFWSEMEEVEFAGQTYANPAALTWSRTWTTASTISWCKYITFWWKKRQYAVPPAAYYDYPTELVAAAVIPGKDNGYASELRLLDKETNGFKERLLGDGNIRRPFKMDDWITNDPDTAITACRAVMNSVTYMRQTDINNLFLSQAQRVSDRLDAVEDYLVLVNDPTYNSQRYTKLNLARLWQRFMFNQHSLAWGKVQTFLNTYIPELERIHLGGTAQNAQGGVQTNDDIVARIGLLLTEYATWQATGWANPIPQAWA